MNVSLAWIFDHIDADWKKVNITSLVEQFNATTAEIEGVEKFSLDPKKFSIVQVTNHDATQVTATSKEWNKTLTLDPRTDIKQNSCYLVITEDNVIRWARISDIGGNKTDVVPAVLCSQKALDGSWKKDIEWDDYILEMDNKTITNRPDMWGHRGFAREIAAILKLPFKSIESFIASQEVHDFEQKSPVTQKTPIAIYIQAPKACRRFAGLHIGSIHHQPCAPWMAFRLARIDARPIDLLVDLTNYVMFDLSQPMHVFDVNQLNDKRIVPRMARKKETLTLLDDQIIDLTEHDLVITDGLYPIALAGIMGGKDSAERNTTTEIFVESANFDAATIRLSAMHHKLRTESSARFEKGLDPQQNITGLQRFLKLLQDTGVPFEQVSDIASVGPNIQEHTIDITHNFLESRIGAQFKSTFVIKTLETIGFAVNSTKTPETIVYQVTVPSFRATHITLPEDIVEEVARFFGYTNIVPQPTEQVTHVTNIHPIMRVRKLKQHCAHALQMMEIQYYSLFDQSYLHTINWEPQKSVKIKNPVSQNWTQLATSLMPNLFKAVTQNAAHTHELNFFQWGRTWSEMEKLPKHSDGYVVGTGPYVVEKKSLAGILFDAKNPIDFYDAKNKLNSMFELLDMPVDWIKTEVPKDRPWYNENQTANVVHDDHHIGIAGIVSPQFFAHIAEGNAFIFELDGDYLQNYQAPTPIFKPPSKYPHVWLDISMLVPLSSTVAGLSSIIKNVDQRISSVELVDFFAKEAWGNKKSLTFRFVVTDATKTLTKDEIDSIWQAVVGAVTKAGAQVR